jgi:hypothetical protein
MSGLSLLFFLIAIAIACISMSDKMGDAEAAKAGLQQCVVENHVIWQRECYK